MGILVVRDTPRHFTEDELKAKLRAIEKGVERGFIKKKSEPYLWLQYVKQQERNQCEL